MITNTLISAVPSTTINVAIIGAGICGSSAASALAQAASNLSKERTGSGSTACSPLLIDVYDQGRNGVGGRASHRALNERGERQQPAERIDGTQMRWDHGCQFFRADTPQMQEHVNDWINDGLCEEWKGNFVRMGLGDGGSSFFGMPNLGPFYVGVGGMHTLPQGLIDRACETGFVNVFNGVRISDIEHDAGTNRWILSGASGEAAYHDSSTTSKKITTMPPGDSKQYDVVLLTDISSTSFGTWHRASANVPKKFADKVKQRLSARVPLFSAMVAYETPVPTDASTITFSDDPTIWFASRSKHKPGLGSLSKDCWTLISTPEYAMQQIEETPMQDPSTGAFVPQGKDYLSLVPGPDLERAFRDALLQSNECHLDELQRASYIHAQRWGSALPAFEGDPKKMKVIGGVTYDSTKSSLAPTEKASLNHDTLNFVVDEHYKLIQAGDMVSVYTPGFEAAALSGADAAAYIVKNFLS